jgi:chromosome segregation protein
MRLKTIKLVGFKSFVDPTTVPFRSNLTAIVGPNGCGKSNIIDAVRWVMGESSAKHLRGESMSDVIFSGSDSRKPVGQASIELVFDNSDGTISGEYARYNELAIKRLVTREGQSQYFLNGNQCRKKDITHIFLGTGLGPRSYAIIEQGIISRLIEAKPDELRVYIEEAAGVSKYKERRKETERRIRHTRDNLERLNDIREELGRQLAHLSRQAKAAERYKTFKADERQLKAELIALKWQSFSEQAAQYQTRIQDAQVKLSAAEADHQGIETAIEKARLEAGELSDQFNEVQAKYYGAGADIAGLEQTIKHNKERREQLEADLSQLNQSERSALEHITQDDQVLQQVRQKIEQLQPQLDALSETYKADELTLQEAESAMQQWQQGWDQFQEQSASINQEVEVLQTQIQHAEMLIGRADSRLNHLQKEHDAIAIDPSQAELTELQNKLQTAQSDIESVTAKVSKSREELQQLRTRRDQKQTALQENQRKVQLLEGEEIKLQALQQAQLETVNEEVNAWFDEAGLSKTRLTEAMTVKSGWEVAVETVLSGQLNALSLKDVNLDDARINSLQGGRQMFFLGDRDKTSGGLLDYIDTDFPLPASLANIKTADALADALSRRSQLKPHESIICKDGTWVGSDWLWLPPEQDKQGSIIEREQRLRVLSGELDAARLVVESATSELAELRNAIKDKEEQWHAEQGELNTLNQHASAIQSEISRLESRLSHDAGRKERLAREVSELQQQITDEAQKLSEYRGAVESKIATMSEGMAEREKRQAERDNLRVKLQEARDKVTHSRREQQELSVELESLKIRQSTTQNAKDRAELQVTELGQRKEQLMAALAEDQTPTEDLEVKLQEALSRHQAIEKSLKEARHKMEVADQGIRQLEAKRHAAEQHTQQCRSTLENFRLESQTIKVRLANEHEQLVQVNQRAEDLLANMPEDASQEEWLDKLELLGNKIQRLGAINLAAIEEFDTQSERKVYMDQQVNDLEEALTTLENAIRKIDKETTTRFRETFDTVNNGLQELFPKVFGGGHAYLELTGDDLLSTGVSVMARPPGKRNSSISALSGGEKALTAIALVFAIFQMNPSPFCMLDEVDAPLDEANLGRFCRLVEEMAETVQFIYITHRKVTIEMAQHLSGVTMHEPGVSRMVSVDLEEATSLAESA